MIPFHFPSRNFLIIVIFIFLIHLSVPAFAVNQPHIDCGTPLPCGDNVNISYPFWGSGRPDYCGHPDFELNCTGGDSAEINIMSVSYRILDITYELQTLKLARKDYEDDLCPTNAINTTLNQSLFNFSPDTQLVTLFYSCAENDDIPFNSIGEISCPANGNNGPRGYYFRNDLPNMLAMLSEFNGSCLRSVSVPVSGSEIQKVNFLIQDDLKKAFDKGFDLKWEANNSACDDCIKSEGVCGQKPKSGRFACHCATETYDLTCGTNNKSGTKNKPMIIGVSVAAAGAAAILLVAAMLVIHRRRKLLAAEARSKDTLATPSSPTPLTMKTTMTFSPSVTSLPPSDSSLVKSNGFFGAQVFSYAELEEATENFSKELGDGGFGTVYYGVLRDGRAVAVKRLYENNLKRAQQFANEVQILTRLKHPNLVTLYGCTSRHSRELILVYDYIPKGTVSDHLHPTSSTSSRRALLSWHLRLNIAVETASALAYLHASDVIHRDVKTNNILLDSEFRVKVADFGLSRLFPTHATHVSTAPQGTPGYVDPEYYQCYQVTEKSDVYSFGVVLVELISGKEAVDVTRHRYDINLASMALNRIQNGVLHELVDPEIGFESDHRVRQEVMAVAELAFRCLQQERDIRPSMAEVLEALHEVQRPDKAEVVDITAEEASLLKNAPPPLSPESTDKGDSGSTTKSSF